jgi:hypothetical protein
VYRIAVKDAVSKRCGMKKDFEEISQLVLGLRFHR